MKTALAVVVVAVVAALGAWVVWPSGKPVKTLAPIGFGLHYRAPTGSSSLLTFWSNGKPIPPVTPLFASLRAPRTAADTVPPEARLPLELTGSVPAASAMSAAMKRTFERTSPGRIELDRSRLLLDVDGRRLYAAPTVRGAVCFILVSDGIFDCIRQLSDGLVWLSLEQSAKRTIVVGLVPDRVSKVEVAIGGARRVATIGRNAFLADVRGVRASQISALVVTADGRRFRLPLDPKEFRR